MRREDREVTDIDSLEAIMQEVHICYLGFKGGEYPYVVPLNFGYTRDRDRFCLYFHCASEGEKIDRMREDPRVSFALDTLYKISGGREACGYTTYYRSVMGHGTLHAVPPDEKGEGMAAIMRQIDPQQDFAIPREALDAVTVLRLDVEEITGKAHREA